MTARRRDDRTGYSDASSQAEDVDNCEQLDRQDPIVALLRTCRDRASEVIHAGQTLDAVIATVHPDHYRAARVDVSEFATSGANALSVFAATHEELDEFVDDFANRHPPNGAAERAVLESRRAEKHRALMADAAAITEGRNRAGLPEYLERYEARMAEWIAAARVVARTQPTTLQGCGLMAEFVHERLIADGHFDRDLVASAAKNLSTALAVIAFGKPPLLHS
ncbi:hypothetical protein GGR25_002281 [Kaistia hirudinis]|uniref:Uncharacterized protein n=1 Tax=Kaistia hirudinis TaxID=1293440 RepID=A0A840AQU1_9HYPH|nr:hypothetical protein [Kaistia hirudinis]MBB3931231.1 hypothetical protein [Kaistia hirudinis]